jgi:protein MpaA
MRAFTVAVIGSIMFVTAGGALGASAESPPVSTTSIMTSRIIGTSVEGRPIEAYRRGTPGGTVVLVIGVIHGDETAGLDIVSNLMTIDIPTGIDLWLVPTMNPDGVAHRTHTNANGVDLNRNFPYRWKKIFQLGSEQYSGTARSSEPETKAMVKFIREIQPELGIWYHQDLHRISPGVGIDGELRARYSQLTGLPLKRITGGTYWGIAATWQRYTISNSYAFVVELGPTPVGSKQITRNTEAVLNVAVLRRSLNGM